MEKNEIFELAEKWVNETNQNIFLTGKAGTGKTTFLKHIKQTTPKRSVILAPTGVAAINAGGSTLHSFFRLPFATFVPAYRPVAEQEQVITPQTLFSRLRYNRQHIQLLRTVELIIIDEVSMVRADILDMIDLILKRFRLAQHLPFGGVQMLFIGDMHQLPPVVKEDDARLLSEYYGSPYFFDSHILKDNLPVMVQLNKVYRQQEARFLDLLNELRHNELSEDNYERLRGKVTDTSLEDDRYITLTSHVRKSDQINERGMAKLPGPAEIYHAVIEGDFPEYQFPAATELVMKRDARVMFIKNDPDKKYYNGKIGTVTKIESDAVWVLCDDDKVELKVEALNWDNIKYSVDKQSGGLNEEVVGKFWQLPLRPAWAVTIHKSQGLTFDFVVIDAEKAFAPGQVYVALSRCRTWEGIVLLSRIKPESLFTDLNIVQFSERIWKQDKLENTLPAYRHHFQTEVLLHAFSLNEWLRYQEQMLRNVLEFETSFSAQAKDFFRQLAANMTKLAQVANKFIPQLEQLNTPQQLPEENEALQMRVGQACRYFIKENEDSILTMLRGLPAAPDNAVASANMLRILDTIREATYTHQAVWKSMEDKFTVLKALQAKSKGLHELTQMRPLKWVKEGSNAAQNTKGQGGELERLLRRWRADTAEMMNTDAYMVLSNKAIDGIVKTLPLNHKELLQVSGIGQKKVAAYGLEILSIIGRLHELKPEEAIPEKKKAVKNEVGETYNETLLLFEAGMPIEAIAKARNLVKTTIEGHFAKLISLGRMDIAKVMDEGRRAKIVKVIEGLPKEEKGLAKAKEILGADFSFGEIRMVIEDIRKS